MLTYSFENMGNDSLYEYLYKCIKKDILEGRLEAERKLPSKRSFAKNLGISVITVENAYAQLVAEGYIYSLPKSGYYVAEIRKYLLTPEEEAQKKGSWQEKENAENQQQKLINEESNTPAIDLVNGRTDPAQFPFTIWARLLREILSEKKEELMNRSPGAGIPELRRAIAEYLFQYQNMQVDAEQVIVGAGTEYLYGLILQLLGQDKLYALEDPGYLKLDKIYGSHGVRTAYIPMDENGVLVERLLESRAEVMHISPSHHYPTGITTPIGRRYELLAWANEREGRYIIEDDYDCEFRMAGRTIPTLQSIDQLGRVIYMNTFAKSLTSTIRISYMVLPMELLKKFKEKLGFYSCTVSNFEQYTLAEFIARGYFEKHINRMRNYYRGKRDELLTAIKESPLGEKVSVLQADAGLHFLLKVNTEFTDEELILRAENKGIRISCLSGYYHMEQEKSLISIKNLCDNEAKDKELKTRSQVIVNYSGLEKNQIKELVKVLDEAWR